MLVKKYTLIELKSVFIFLSLATHTNLRDLNLNVITTKWQAGSKPKKINIPFIDGKNSVNEVRIGEK